MPKRLAIVSSYNEECGAAFDSSHLKLHLEAAGHQVEIKCLPVSLLRVSAPRAIRRNSDQEIRRSPPNSAATMRAAAIRTRALWIEPAQLLPPCARAAAGQPQRDPDGAWLRPRRPGRGRRHPAAIGSLLSRDVGAAYRNLMFPWLADDIDAFWNYVRGQSHIKVLTFCRADQMLLDRFYSVPRIANYPISY